MNADDLTQQELLAVTPGANIKQRQERYIGDTVQISLAELTESDVAILRLLYAFVTELKQLLDDHEDDGTRSRQPATVADVLRFMEEHDYDGVVHACQRLGASLTDAQTTPAIKRVYHDIRGASLTGIVARLGMLKLNIAEEDVLDRLFILSRDHLKIMRNGVPDLDPAGYQNDLVVRTHGVALLCDKWTDVDYHVEDTSAHVSVDCDFDGAVSECCMEFAALDRVLYNLINNAARFTADGRVRLMLVPVDDSHDTNLRIAVVNRISADQAGHLRAQFGDDLGPLFLGGFTTGGHGIGLRNCADFVAHGYTLPSVEQSLERGYIGARLLRQDFVAWFHWPARRADA